MLLNQPQKTKQLISLTPLIDVVFILLLFFMLTSSFTQFRQIEMHSATTTGLANHQEPPTTLLILNAHSVLLNDAVFEINSDAFQQQLTSMALDNRYVNMAAINSVSVHHLIELIDQIKRAGIINLNISESVTP